MQKDKIKSFVKSLGKILFSGFVVSWLLFWYLSGTFLGFPRFLFTYYVGSQVFMTPVAKTTLFEGALRGMIDSLGEPHSQFLNEEEYASLMDAAMASYSGVGMVLGKTKDGGVEVVSAILDQPAAKAGIESGDQIITIDGVKVSSLPIEEASKRIRGEAGTQVVLGIQRGDEIKDYTITREKIILPTVTSKMIEPGVGYIRVTQFAETTGKDFGTQYAELKEQGMKRLIVDLRGNPGGLLTVAEEVGNYLLPKGTLVTVQDRSGQIMKYDSDGLSEPIPMVILINKGSASASEIIAGAVQDCKVGLIVGTNSYGKGTVQTILPEIGGAGVKVTIAKYHTPNDRVIDGIGIKPDIEVALPEGIGPKNTLDDIQIQKALDILNNK